MAEAESWRAAILDLEARVGTRLLHERRALNATLRAGGRSSTSQKKKKTEAGRKKKKNKTRAAAEETWCPALKMAITEAKLRRVLDALHAPPPDSCDTVPKLCDHLRRKRPDLMRGRALNVLRAFLEVLHPANMLTFGWWFAAQKIGYLLYLFGVSQHHVGQLGKKIERDKARMILRMDPRGYFAGRRRWRAFTRRGGSPT